jgi:ABC-type amino acid transport substrate-binding protein
MAPAAAAMAQSSTITISGSDYTKRYLPLLEAIYGELGYRVNFLEEPAERALRDANSGVADANVGRVLGALDLYPNLLYTKEPLTTVDVQVWARKGTSPLVRTLEDLKRYSVGAAIGSKAVELLAQSAGLSLEQAVTVDQLAAMLGHRRIDLALVTDITVTPALSAVGWPMVSALSSQKAYHIVNRAHADLIPRFDAIARAMKFDGRYKKFLPEKPIP